MKYVLPALLVIAVVLLIFRVTRDKETSAEMQIEMPSNMRVVKVDEVIQASTYTYLQVKENSQKYWIAVAKIDAKEGETYSYETAIEMKDFPSKELDRTFESIFFVDNLMKGNAAQRRAVPAEHETSKPRTDMDESLKVEKAAGGISIGELFAGKKEYKDQIVTIRGKVVKVNPAVMGMNWVHIQDGTKDGDDYDLTITTLEEVEKDAILTFKGVITLDKDFGAGYFYKVIMEDAELVPE